MTAWDLSCRDWETRLRQGRAPIADLPLDKTRADRAVAIFNELRLPDVPGNPRLAEACGDWFRDAVVRPLFGSWDPQTQERYIREIFALVPKKNSKTTYGAALMLVALLLNERPVGAFHLFAPTQDITVLSFDQLAGMIRLDADLMKRIKIQDHIRTVTHRATGATLEVMSFDPKVVTGQKSAGWMIDELHVMARMAKADSALRQIRGGMQPQPEAFGLIITTQSETAPTGVFKTELTKARAVRDGEASARMLPVLYEFPRAIARSREAWRDVKNWPLVLPNLGRSISVARLAELMRDEEAGGEEKLRLWASQHLNVEIGLALGSDAWAGADFWRRRADPTLNLETLIERSEVITIGLDGGGLQDLFGLAVVGRERETKRWLVWCHAWAHRIVLKRRKADAPKFLELAELGELTLFGDASAFDFDDGADAEPANDDAPPLTVPEDIAGIVQIVKQVDESGLLHSIGLDRAGIGAVVDALADPVNGIEGITDGADSRIKAVPQGYMLMGAIKTVERKLSDGTLVHADQRLTDFAVASAKVEVKANYMLVTKQASGSGKIDPLMAIFDAAALMGLNPEIERSIYTADRGLVVFG